MGLIYAICDLCGKASEGSGGKPEIFDPTTHYELGWIRLSPQWRNDRLLCQDCMAQIQREIGRAP